MLLGRARRILGTHHVCLVTGNLTRHGAGHELEALRRALQGAEVFALPGPSDVVAAESAEARERAWAQRFGLEGQFPFRLDLEGCVLLGLDSTRMAPGNKGFGGPQLARLEAILLELPAETRKVLAMHHDPGGRMPDGEVLLELCARFDVDLVLHGELRRFQRRKRGKTTFVCAPSTTAGCGLSGQRFFLRHTLDPETGAHKTERVHHAPPEKGGGALAEAFAATDTMRSWQALAEKVYEADDSLRALAEELQGRAERIAVLDAASEQLDGDLMAMLRDLEGGDE